MSISMPTTLRNEIRELAEANHRTVAMQIKTIFDEWRKSKGAGN